MMRIRQNGSIAEAVCESDSTIVEEQARASSRAFPARKSVPPSKERHLAYQPKQRFYLTIPKFRRLALRRAKCTVMLHDSSVGVSGQLKLDPTTSTASGVQNRRV